MERPPAVPTLTLAVLTESVHRHLDASYAAEQLGDRPPWPTALEALTGWKPQDEGR